MTMASPGFVMLSLIVLGVVALAALFISAAALGQTQAIWKKMSDHETQCRDTDRRLFEKIEKQYQGINLQLRDLSDGVARLEGGRTRRRRRRVVAAQLRDGDDG